MKRAVAGYAILAAVLAAVAWVVIHTNPGAVLIKGQAIHDTVVAICFLVYLFALALGLAVGFVGRLRSRLLCTYQTVAYLTFCVFVGASACVLTYQLVALAMSGEAYSVTTLVGAIGSLSTTFIVLSVPGVVIVSFFLLVSNIVLIRKEGLRPSNTLGIIVGIVAAIGFAVVFYLDWTLWGATDVVSLSIRVVVPYVVNFFEMLALATTVCAYLAVRHEPPLDRDYAIILGCAIRADGTPLRVLAGRIDRAMEFARKQEESTGRRLAFVCSGGKGSDEIISEAESMARYLRDHGIPEDRILLEDRSTNTRENMAFSRAVIDEAWERQGVQGARPKTAYVTTNYHVFRGGTFALQAGLEAEGLAAKTAWYYWPNAFLREFVALVVTSAGFVATVLACIVLFSVGVAATYNLLLLASTA